MSYEKLYATVVKRLDGIIVVKYDNNGMKEELQIRWKNGSKSSRRIVKGARIKVYRRPGVPHPNFRLMGD